MADLTFKDWGRIYAYMWLQDLIGNPHYRILLESNPVQGVTEIIQALNSEYPDLKIEYIPNVDAVWDVEPPAELKGQADKIKEYRNGEKRAVLSLRFAC